MHNSTILNSPIRIPQSTIRNQKLVFPPPPPANPHRIRSRSGVPIISGRASGRFLLVALVGLFLTGLPVCSKHSPELPTAQSSLTPNHPDLVTYSVTRIVDGDTIVLSDKTSIRYIGIDTPETKHPRKPVQLFGKEASEANRKLVEGKKVRLEYDVQKTDKYGRTLAYVYLEDGTFVNAWLVENGYARVSTYPPNVKYQDKFIELARKAREEKRGLWKK